MHKDLSVMFRYIPLRSILHNSRLIVNPVSHDGRQKIEICVVPSCIRSGMEINMQKEGISYWQWTAGITVVICIKTCIIGLGYQKACPAANTLCEKSRAEIKKSMESRMRPMSQ